MSVCVAIDQSWGEAEVPLSTDSQAESGTLSVQPVNKVEAHIFLPISRPPSSENWLIAITVIFSKKHLFKIIKGNDGQIGERLARGGKSLSKTKQRSPLFKTIKVQSGILSVYQNKNIDFRIKYYKKKTGSLDPK